MRRKTVEYIVGADLENLDCWVTSNRVLIDLSSGYSFSLAVTSTDGTVQFTKTSGITGDTGSGTEESGSPNLMFEWDTSGELNTLDAGRYIGDLTITRIADGRQRRRQFYLDMIQSYT